ncbi:hypothetical protein [Roseateles sp.]|uniref:hypothetical protein n=1 Tax=Roseateles sp. TaxID=1971397 RepID=UPI00326493C3
MRRLILAAAITIGVTVGGCATTNTNTLARPAVETSVTLRSNFVYTRENSGLTNRNVWTISLASGTYKSVFEDSAGTYYRSSGNELVERRDRHDFGSETPSKTFTYVYNGGIYLPKEATQTAKIFIIAGTMRAVQSPEDGSTKTEGGRPVTVFIPNVSPGQAAAGGIVANVILAAGAASERGNIAFYRDFAQPDGAQLRGALVQ